jgi:hypothetical protein
VNKTKGSDFAIVVSWNVTDGSASGALRLTLVSREATIPAEQLRICQWHKMGHIDGGRQKYSF